MRRTCGGVSFTCEVLPIGDVVFTLENERGYRFGFFEWYAHAPEKAASRLLELHGELVGDSSV